jgi:hypothetical protein
MADTPAVGVQPENGEVRLVLHPPLAMQRV